MVAEVSLKRALITGITGQDGSYLTEFLLARGYEVHGLIRRSSSFNTGRIDHLHVDRHEGQPRMLLHFGDLSDGTGLRRALETIQPDEVYNLAAQSHVKVSFDMPEYSADIVGMGALRLLEAVRDHATHLNRPVRFYQAGSSEMFGAAPAPQNEKTPFHPRSPYAVAKVAAHWFTVNYREAYGLYACNGILFNHESPRRGETFVTRKITRAISRILAGRQAKLYLGNLDARRDWGFAGDYVEAMWLILQQPEPDDYVIATDQTHSVRAFLEEAFGLVRRNWQDFVELDPRYLRPAEVDLLLGDASKARQKLNWTPKVDFKALVRMMLRADMIDEGLDPDAFMD